MRRITAPLQVYLRKHWQSRNLPFLHQRSLCLPWLLLGELRLSSSYSVFSVPAHDIVLGTVGIYSTWSSGRFVLLLNQSPILLLSDFKYLPLKMNSFRVHKRKGVACSLFCANFNRKGVVICQPYCSVQSLYTCQRPC